MIHVVSFSGGRTSAYLVHLMEQRRIKEDLDVRYIYMDTGAEHPKTYEFIKNVVSHWGVNLTCLRVVVNPSLGQGNSYEVIQVSEIKHDLGPWKAIVKKYGLPYPAGAFCTREMKFNPVTKYCKDNFDEYTTWIGIRADNHYWIGKLDSNLIYEIDADNDANAEYAKKQVIKLRKDDEIDQYEAREYWDLIESSDDVKDDCCNSFIGGKLLSLFGDDAWYNDWSTIPNPQYLRMESRLNAVREVLKQIKVN